MLRTFFFFIGLGLLSTNQTLAAPQLYETGPEKDAAFVRFFNVTKSIATISTSRGSAIKLDPETPGTWSTSWASVKPQTPLRAKILYKGEEKAVEIVAEPGQFITIAILEGPHGMSVRTVREKADEFSSHKVSLGLLNLDPKCSSASIKLAGKELGIVEDTPPDRIVRRMINPVHLAVDLYCDGQRTLENFNLNLARPGERWTLLVAPEGNRARMQLVLDRLP